MTQQESNDEISAAVKIEYVKIWMQQSQLFWSRLQTISALQTGILVGWYKLANDPCLRIGILLMGIILSALILFIMRRDTKYMKKMEELAKNEFPTANDCKDAPTGRQCGYAIVAVLILADLILLKYN